ncbi:MAG: acetyl-CoA hydrolase/transferase C-terminal domain-containing protein [Desulfosudaceae bacterium]
MKMDNQDMITNIMEKETRFIDNVERCVDYMFEVCGKKLVLGLPLALGKSHYFANEVYRRAKADPEIQLVIATALSLEKPSPSSQLEQRVMRPIVDRIWKGVPDFEYMIDLRHNDIPANVALKEFYFKAGSFINTTLAQQNHYSSNYTHVVRDMINEVLEDKPDWAVVFCQMVAKKEIDGQTRYSESCNADLGLDLLEFYPELLRRGIPHLRIAQVNNQLPFMYGDAVHEAGAFDIIIDNPDYETPLFSVPKQPVSVTDHMIGLHVSTLIKDGGTLQVGIGSLGDAISSSLLLRHHDPATYREVINSLGLTKRYQKLIDRVGGLGSFEQGLYGSTEMLVGVFLDLYQGGILKRKVYTDEIIQKAINEGVLTETITAPAARAILQDPSLHPILREEQFLSLQNCGFFKPELRYDAYRISDGQESYSADLRDETEKERILANCIGQHLRNGIVSHGSFFIGPNRFYDALRDMSEEERRQFSMTGVAYVNQLYGDQRIKELQRRDARFVNAGMKITLMGNIASDALEDGRVISGVGGQYNFVSMAHALKDARLIMMIKSVRDGAHGVSSNIVFNYGYTTIPRHLKDIVVTEYGIADLRGKVDQEIAKQLINIADSRFQDDLLQKAQKAGKIPPSYRIPDQYRNNYPEALADKLAAYRQAGLFKSFPLGTELTDEEIAIAGSLRRFKQKAGQKRLATFASLAGRMLRPVPEAAAPYLERLQLTHPVGLKERLQQKVVLTALSASKTI